MYRSSCCPAGPRRPCRKSRSGLADELRVAIREGIPRVGSARTAGLRMVTFFDLSRAFQERIARGEPAACKLFPTASVGITTSLSGTTRASGMHDGDRGRCQCPRRSTCRCSRSACTKSGTYWRCRARGTAERADAHSGADRLMGGCGLVSAQATDGALAVTSAAPASGGGGPPAIRGAATGISRTRAAGHSVEGVSMRSAGEHATFRGGELAAVSPDDGPDGPRSIARAMSLLRDRAVSCAELGALDSRRMSAPATRTWCAAITRVPSACQSQKLGDGSTRRWQ